MDSMVTVFSIPFVGLRRFNVLDGTAGSSLCSCSRCHWHFCLSIDSNLRLNCFLTKSDIFLPSARWTGSCRQRTYQTRIIEFVSWVIRFTLITRRTIRKHLILSCAQSCPVRPARFATTAINSAGLIGLDRCS